MDNHSILIPHKYVYELFVNNFGMAEHKYQQLLHIDRGQLDFAELAELAKLIERPALSRCVSFVCRRDNCVEVSFGGNGVALTRTLLFADEKEVVSLIIMADGLLFNYYDDVMAAYRKMIEPYFIDVSSYRAALDYKLVDLETLLFMLHGIDCVKRLEYLNRLNYRYDENYQMTATSFSDSFSDSVKSFDTRWLLPSFLVYNSAVLDQGIDFSERKMQNILLDDIIELVAQDDQIHYRFSEQIVAFGHDLIDNLMTYLNVKYHSFSLDEGELSAQFVCLSESTNHIFTVLRNGRVEYRYGDRQVAGHGVIELLAYLN